MKYRCNKRVYLESATGRYKGIIEDQISIKEYIDPFAGDKNKKE